jgi:hypothetical protein
MPESVDALVSRIIAAPAPVVFLDTCSILDVIRSGFRSGIQADLVLAARRLVHRAQEIPNSIWIALPEQIEREWNDNSQKVKDELIAVISQTEQQSTRLAAIAGLLVPTERISRLLLPSKLEDHIFTVAQELTRSAQLIAEDGGCIRRAHTRLVRGIAPASGSKQQYKDCVVIEHCLELCALLRAQGFGERLIFVSSNSADYGKPGRAHPPLDIELQAVKLEYVANLAWADSQLFDISTAAPSS